MINNKSCNWCNETHCVKYEHSSDVMMGTMASQITSLAIAYSTVYSGADSRKHQSSASLAFVQTIHRWPVNSPHKRPVTRNMFPFDDVIMKSRFIEPGVCDRALPTAATWGKNLSDASHVPMVTCGLIVSPMALWMQNLRIIFYFTSLDIYLWHIFKSLPMTTNKLIGNRMFLLFLQLMAFCIYYWRVWIA